MKSLKFAALAFAGLAMFSQSAKAVPGSVGDLILAVYNTSDTYAVDLGSETAFSATAGTMNLSNIVSDADLNTIFGAGLSSTQWEVIGTSGTGGPFTIGGTGVFQDAAIVTDVNTPSAGYSHNALSGSASQIGGFLNTLTSSGTTAYSSNSAEAALFATNGPSNESSPSLEWNLPSSVIPEVSFGSTATLYLLNPKSNATGPSVGVTTTLGTFQFVGGTTFEYNYSAVPEPSTYALLGMGALLLVWIVRRRSASNL